MARHLYLHKLILSLFATQLIATQLLATQTKRLPNQQYIAACSAMRDEHPALIQEWVAYHLLLGIGRFYIYDNLSKKPISTHLTSYIRAGLVDVHVFDLDLNTFDEYDIRDDYTQDDQGLRPQLWAFNHCVASFKHRHKFIALFDTDEFIELKPAQNPQQPESTKHAEQQHRALFETGSQQHTLHGSSSQDGVHFRHPNGILQALHAKQQLGDLPLEAFMKEFENTGGLVMFWHVMGSCGHEKRQNSVLESYICCTQRDYVNNQLYVKTIVNTADVEVCKCHTCATLRWLETEHHQIFDKIPNVTHDRIALRHYHYRSLEDFEAKRTRGFAWADDQGNKVQKDVINKYTIDRFRELDTHATEYCPPLMYWREREDL